MLGDWWNETISHRFFREEKSTATTSSARRKPDEEDYSSGKTRSGRETLDGEATDYWYWLQCQQSKGDQE